MGGEEKVPTRFRFGNVTERDHYKDQRVDGGCCTYLTGKG